MFSTSAPFKAPTRTRRVKLIDGERLADLSTERVKNSCCPYLFSPLANLIEVFGREFGYCRSLTQYWNTVLLISLSFSNASYNGSRFCFINKSGLTLTADISAVGIVEANVEAPGFIPATLRILRPALRVVALDYRWSQRILKRDQRVIDIAPIAHWSNREIGQLI